MLVKKSDRPIPSPSITAVIGAPGSKSYSFHQQAQSLHDQEEHEQE